MKKIDNYDDFVAALYEMLAINDELKITYIENMKVYRNQFSVKTDGFPPKGKKKSCCLCKGEHLTFSCSQLTSLNDTQKKIELLKSKKLCFKCLLSFNVGHRCPDYCRNLFVMSTKPTTGTVNVAK